MTRHLHFASFVTAPVGFVRLPAIAVHERGAAPVAYGVAVALFWGRYASVLGSH